MNTAPMLRDNALKGKVVLITGGGTGLGRSIGERALQLGADLVITGRRKNILEETAQELEKTTGGKVLPLSCDVRDADQVEQTRDQAIEHFGKVDVLVNNAAGNFISPTERLSPNAFGTIIDIVLKGSVNCTLLFGKEWIAREQEQATVLNIVTTYSWTGSSFVVPSACAKAGVLALTRSLAVEWAKYGIRSNAIAPGLFPTKGAWERLLPGELQEKLDPTREVPLKRLGEQHELADLASYLISDFSSFINGEVITIDGGQWLKGAGQFDRMENISPEMWDEIEKMVRQTSRKG